MCQVTNARKQIINRRQIIHKLFVTTVLSCSIVDVISEKEYIDLKQNLIRMISPRFILQRLQFS